jgi:hypothetical protein
MARACRLRWTSRFICNSLAVAALDRTIRALRVVNALGNTVRIAKIKFRDVAVQVLLAAVLINAFHATLEN